MRKNDPKLPFPFVLGTTGMQCTGKQRSYREIARMLDEQGHRNEKGKLYGPAAIYAMVTK